jgi:polysaccharide export outer membrane protein
MHTITANTAASESWFIKASAFQGEEDETKQYVMRAFAIPHAAEYVIGEGDTLLISVWGEKDLSLSVKVRPDGKITLPALGEVTAADTSAKNLQTVLTNKLRGIVKNPVVTVIVMEITNNKVYIFGGGVKAGVYSLVQRTTLLQLLVRSKTPDSGPEKAYVLRHGKGSKSISRNSSSRATRQRTSRSNRRCYFMPTNPDKNVYVMGASTCRRPLSTARPDRHGSDPRSGGFTRFASPNDTIIYRKDEYKKEITISVKMKRLMNSGDLNRTKSSSPAIISS